jgi:hypothetical protein
LSFRAFAFRDSLGICRFERGPFDILVVAGGVLLACGARAQDFPKPSAEHERLKQLAGVWDAHVKSNFEPGKPQESKGEFTTALDLGGFFLVTEFKGELAGAKFHGRGITGYDPFKKKYVGVWVDSMSPAVYTSEGSFDQSGKVFTESMEGPDPKGKPMKMRIVTEVKDSNHMRFSMYVRGEDGKEALMMETAYTRKK